jgi:hypothetical protein
MHPIAAKTGNKRAMNSSPLGFCEVSVPEGLGSIALIQSERDEGGGSGAPACPLESVGQAVGLADREGDLSQAGRSFDVAGGAVAFLAAQLKREPFPAP